MKLAVAGKGGSGKTSISGTMARVLARSGRRVLAIDGDSNPNLALTLGIPPSATGEIPTLTHDMLERTPEGARLTKPLEEICAMHSLQGTDGITPLVMAHPQHAGAG